MFHLRRKKPVINKSEIPEWSFAADPKKVVLAIDEHYCPQCDHRLGDTHYRFDDTDIRIIDISYYDTCDKCGGEVDHYEDWPIEDMQQHTLNKIELVSRAAKPWYDPDFMEYEDGLIKVDDNHYILDPRYEWPERQYCYVHGSFGRKDYTEFTPCRGYQGVFLEQLTEGLCYGGMGDYDAHPLSRVATYGSEDCNRTIMNKLDLLQNTSRKGRNGFFARIRKMFKSKNVREYGKDVIFVDPKKMSTANAMYWPYCCLCDKDVDKALGNEWIDADRTKTVITMVTSGEDYSTDTVKYHLIDTEQILPIEDVMQFSLRKEPLHAKNKKRIV